MANESPGLLPDGEPIQLTEPKVDPEKLLLEGVDTSRGPTFSVSELGKMFFARSPHWVRLAENEGKFVLDGQPVGVTRTDKGARVYTLTDVEQIAHALAQNGAINGRQLRNALMIVAVEAEIWEYV